MFAPFLLNEGSEYALACVDTAPGLTQAFPCPQANQDAIIRGLEKLSMVTLIELAAIDGHISKLTIYKTGQKNTTSNRGAISFITHKEHGRWKGEIEY